MRPRLRTVLKEWGRIGSIGFGGPPTHIRLFRQLCVDERHWLDPVEFEDALATCNLLPGPASTQLAIFCAWRVRGWFGALLGGAAFILPGLVAILALSALFLENAPPRWVLAAGAGAGAAVAAVALHAGVGLVPDSWRRSQSSTRWVTYLALGAISVVVTGPWVVVVLIACGLAEVLARGPRLPRGTGSVALPLIASGLAASGGLGALSWVALKVGALSYGGGFVIVPLMRADAVNHYHWMTAQQFLNAIALGQVTPGPVVQTVAVVGYAAAGLGGGLLAALIAFAPSFAFVLGGAAHFDRLRGNRTAQGFLAGAGPAAIGAILGTVVPLTRSLNEGWQYAVLAVAAIVLLVFRRGTVVTLLLAAAVGVLVVGLGFALPS